MKIDELKKRLEDEFPKIYNPILINGKWGIGKTYFIKKEFLKYKNPIYISLFGINSFEDFKVQMYFELDKILGFIKKVNKSIENTNIGIGWFSMSIPYFEQDIVKIIKRKKKEFLIVIDDLERKSSNINMEEILGLLESLTAIKELNIIIIANEEKMQPDDKTIYDNFKEKVIQKTYNIDEYSKKALSGIINTISLENIKKDIQRINIKQCIEEFFLEHKVSNLRTVEKAIKFLSFILGKINVKELSEKEINDIVIICISIVVQDVEKLYESPLNNEKDSFMNALIEEQVGEMSYNIIKNYFKEKLTVSGKHNIINPLFEIYNDKDTENNVNKINKYFEDKKELSKNDLKIDEDNMFYLSEEHQIHVVENFYKECVLKTNSKIDINNWFKKLNSMYCYAKIIDKHSIFEEEKILSAMDSYMEQIIVEGDLYHLLDKNMYLDISDEKMKEYNNILNQKKINKYYWTKIDNLKCLIANDKVKYEDVESLFSLYRENRCTEKEKIVEEIEKNNYFIPNLNGDISEKKWTLSHKIWSEMHTEKTFRDNKFEKFVKKLLEQSTTLGKYRINSLNEQYKIIIDEICE